MHSPIEEIKSRLDLVELIQGYIRLQHAGANYKANCPFHSEKTPSFFISPAKQIWHCFGCGKGGDMFKFIQEIEGYDFPEALRLLAGRAGVILKREDPRIRSERNVLYDIAEEAARIFEYVLTRTQGVEEYLAKRGLTKETIKEFRIGFAPASWDFLAKGLAAKRYRKEDVEKAGLIIKSQDGSSWYDRFRSRVMFPITDANGRVIGFGGRIFEQEAGSGKLETVVAEAKYINTPQTPIYDKSHVLYGFDKSKQHIRNANAAVVVEGYMDCVMSHQANVKNTVAVSGTALTHPQLTMIRRLCDTIISSFDTDAAGESATRRSLTLAADFYFKRRVVNIPSGKDPADTVCENPEAWRAAVDSAQDVAAFYVEKAFRDFDIRTPQGKQSASALALPFVGELSDEIVKAHWVKEISRRMDVPEHAVWKEVERLRTKEAGKFSSHEARDEKDRVEPILTRRERLEERFLSLLAALPVEIRIRETQNHRLTFHNQMFAQLFPLLISEKDINTDQTGSAEALKILAFKGEVLFTDILHAEEELMLCRRSLEREHIKEELLSLAQEIAQREQQKDYTTASRLLNDFKQLSDELKTCF